MPALLKTTQIQEPSSATVNLTLDTLGNASFAGMPYGASSFLRNRIINGDMRIDQRNAGASVTPSTGTVTYITDRFWVYGTQASKFTAQQNAGSVTPPTDFTNYIGITSSSAYAVTSTDQFILVQSLEGFNTSDFNFGTANAKTVTLSFWVRSSLTGTFAGGIQNYATTRSYPFTYVINSANTWEQKTITIAGDTSGTWVGGSSAGYMNVFWTFGAGSTFQSTANAWASGNYKSVSGAQSVVGTNGATFYITGVQLEVGTAATPFERRLYGQELALCQRYCYVIPKNTYMGLAGQCYGTTVAQGAIPMPVSMRSSSTLTAVSDFTGFNIYSSTASFIQMTVFTTAAAASNELFFWNCNVASGLTAGNATLLQKSPTNVPLIFSAEL
jgi:hypothetical protein